MKVASFAYIDKIYTICFNVYTMKRYQVYLNQSSVSVIDDYEELTNISRSKIIRYLVDSTSEQLITLIRRKEPKKKYLMDQLSGFIDLKIDKKIDLVSSIDNVLLQKI